MIAAPLTLDLSFPRKIVLETNVDGGAFTREIVTRCDHEFSQNKDNQRQWQVILTVHFEGKDGAATPYKGCVEYVGLFTVTANYPTEKMQRLVAITCPSLLYSAIRELVALLTGRGPHRLLILPTVSFQDGDLKPQAADASARPQMPAPVPTVPLEPSKSVGRPSKQKR